MTKSGIFNRKSKRTCPNFWLAEWGLSYLKKAIRVKNAHINIFVYDMMMLDLYKMIKTKRIYLRRFAMDYGTYYFN